jgi:hypothetical protein
MRVTMEHREEAMGITGRKACFVDCKVEFSEEERAIIRERDLYAKHFTIGAATPVPSATSFFSTNMMRLLGRILIIVGLIASFKTGYGFLFFIGLGLELYGWFRTKREDTRFNNHEQKITVKQLLNNPTFTVHAGDVGYAKVVDQEIHRHLVDLKTVLKANTEVQAKQTFEL